MEEFVPPRGWPGGGREVIFSTHGTSRRPERYGLAGCLVLARTGESLLDGVNGGASGAGAVRGRDLPGPPGPQPTFEGNRPFRRLPPGTGAT